MHVRIRPSYSVIRWYLTTAELEPERVSMRGQIGLFLD